MCCDPKRGTQHGCGPEELGNFEIGCAKTSESADYVITLCDGAFYPCKHGVAGWKEGHDLPY